MTWKCGGLGPVGLLSLLILQGLPYWCQPALGQPVLDSAQRVDALFEGWVTHETPGCAVGVDRHGQSVLLKAYGLANLEHGAPLTTRSVFRSASLAKQFTAMSILLLESEGKLSLEDDVRRFLPELQRYERPVRIRHLLSHTSGYRDYLTLFFYLAGARDDDYVSQEEVLDLLAHQKGLDFTPGDSYIYSNSNYLLLGAVVERITGRTLREFSQAKIFTPLGMKATRFQDDPNDLVPNRAVGYSPDGTSFRLNRTTLGLVGDGGLITTVEDFLIWHRHLQAQGPEARRLLTTGSLGDGSAIGYAGGLIVHQHRGLKRIWHLGFYAGFQGLYMSFPDEDVGLILFCNRSDSDPEALAERISEIFLAERLQEPTLPAGLAEHEGAAFSGLYRDPRTGMMLRLRAEGQKLHLRLPERELSFLARTGREFVSADGFYELLLQQEGRKRQVLFRPLWMPGKPFRVFTVADPPDLSAAELARYAGTYRCPEIFSEIHLDAVDGGLRYRHDYRHKYAPESPLVPTGQDAFANDVLMVEGIRKRRRIVGLRLAARTVFGIECARTR